VAGDGVVPVTYVREDDLEDFVETFCGEELAIGQRKDRRGGESSANFPLYFELLLDGLDWATVVTFKGEDVKEVTFLVA